MTLAIDDRPGRAPKPRAAAGGPPPRRARPVKRDFVLTGWHVLAMLCGLFGVMIAVTVLFVTLALKTFSGEADHAYVNGLKFDETIAAHRAQAAEGWTMRLDLARAADDRAVVTATLRDRDGAPVTGATMSGSIGRPASDAYDKTLRFAEVAPGVYASTPEPLGPGRWVFEATAKAPGKPDFKTETPLSLR